MGTRQLKNPQLRSLRTANVFQKRVLVTAELNVGRDSRGRINDDSRLRAVLPTLEYLRRKQAKIIVATHLGRPAGRRVNALSTKILVGPLGSALRVKVRWVDTCRGAKAEAAVASLPYGQILLLENTRFHPGEEANSRSFARDLSRLADIFVLESFGTANRSHASIIGVGKFLPSYAGLRLQEEVRTLSQVLARPKRPLITMLGGAKISTKLNLIAVLLSQVDGLLLGGALANTILQAKGLQIGRSLTEKTLLRKVRHLDLTNPKLHIPVDVVVQAKSGRITTRAVGAVRRDESILDIGPDTISLFTAVLKTAATIVWNGPLGKYEQQPFDRGTKELARIVSRSRAYSVVGGGETVDAIRSQHLDTSINFLSTGGGAMLEFLEGRKLPGVELVRPT